MPPDRAVPIVFQVAQPGSSLDKDRSLTDLSIGDPDPIKSRAVADFLLINDRRKGRTIVKNGSLWRIGRSTKLSLADIFIQFLSSLLWLYPDLLPQQAHAFPGIAAPRLKLSRPGIQLYQLTVGFFMQTVKR